MAGPKRHHHLAQAIQRNFLAEGANKLWWYSRIEDKYEERTTYAIAHARHTYTFSAVEGEERYTLEKAFSVLEDKAAPALKKLERASDLTQAERNAIAELVGYQFTRTPSKIAFITELLNTGGSQTVQKLAEQIAAMTPEEFESYMKEKRETSGREWDLDQEGLVMSLRTNPPRVTATKEGALESMVKLGTDLAIEYSNRSWVVLHAPAGRSFITSDEGVFLAPGPSVDIRAFGPATKDVATVFPFSKGAALLVAGSGPRIIEHANANLRGVREINDGLARVSREVYSPSRELLESIVKRNKLATTRFEVRVNQSAVRNVLSILQEGKKR